jgi:hypothetical protein
MLTSIFQLNEQMAQALLGSVWVLLAAGGSYYLWFHRSRKLSTQKVRVRVSRDYPPRRR